MLWCIMLTCPCYIWPSKVVPEIFFIWKMAMFFLYLLKILGGGCHKNQLVNGVLMSTHNLSFWAIMIKIRYTSVNLTFHYIKWGLQGYKMHGCVLVMITLQLPTSHKLYRCTNWTMTFLTSNEKALSKFSHVLVKTNSRNKVRLCLLCYYIRTNRRQI